jgi:hypothetical protein
MNLTGKEQTMLGMLLLVILVLALVGALPRWSHSREWGYVHYRPCPFACWTHLDCVTPVYGHLLFGFIRGRLLRLPLFLGMGSKYR